MKSMRAGRRLLTRNRPSQYSLHLAETTLSAPTLTPANLQRLLPVVSCAGPAPGNRGFHERALHFEGNERNHETNILCALHPAPGRGRSGTDASAATDLSRGRLR